MKELNECTAEVFRRSEKRINERKRNFIRILALCIPFCMIVTVWSVLIRPAMMPAGEAYKDAFEEKSGTADAPAINEAEDVLTAPPIDFEAQYIRTNGYTSDIEYPVVRIIRSVRELNAYYEANKENYDLERRDKVSSDMTIGFLDACEKYDEAYFEDKILVMVLLEEGSGSIRHKVQSVNMGADGQCYIYIDTIEPESGTDDMAEWHILIEPETGVEIEKESDITVFVDGINPLTQPKNEKTSMGSLDSFTFSLTWGCYGISSYDSQTGKLVKTTDATNPEDYVTTYQLTPEQKQTIYDLILNLNVTAYPDKYNPNNDMYSAPSMTLILSVNTETVQKTIKAVDIAATYESNNREGQKFLSVCKAIQDMLTSTEEWKSLPEYEFLYD